MTLLARQTRMTSRRRVTAQGAIQLLIPSTEVAPWCREFIEELELPKSEQDRVLFELVCLQILAVHFAITQTLDDEPVKLEAVLTAYYEYWLTYSKAVSVNYAEEIHRRLSRYREAAFAVEKLGASLAIGDLFSGLSSRPRWTLYVYSSEYWSAKISLAVLAGCKSLRGKVQPTTPTECCV